MKFTQKMLTGCVLAVLTAGFSVPVLAAQVKEELIHAEGIHVMTPVVEKSAGGAAVDLAVTNDLSVNTFNTLQGVVAFKHVAAPAPITIADFAKNKPNTVEKTKKSLQDLADFTSLNLKKQATEVKAGKAYSVEGEFDVKNSTDNMLSVVQDFKTYTGGAHANRTMFAGTYDLKTGRKETLANQFEDGTDYKGRLMTLIGIQSRAVARIHGNIIGKKAPVYAPKAITGTEKFYIDGKDAELVVFYNPGEIAPISEGVVKFAFGVDTIGDIMKL